MKKSETKLNQIYTSLLETYGFQGWWPFLNYNGVNINKTGSIEGYHPKLYNFPKNEPLKLVSKNFLICI